MSRLIPSPINLPYALQTMAPMPLEGIGQPLLTCILHLVEWFPRMGQHLIHLVIGIRIYSTSVQQIKPPGCQLMIGTIYHASDETYSSHITAPWIAMRQLPTLACPSQQVRELSDLLILKINPQIIWRSTNTIYAQKWGTYQMVDQRTKSMWLSNLRPSAHQLVIRTFALLQNETLYPNACQQGASVDAGNDGDQLLDGILDASHLWASNIIHSVL